MNAQDFQTGNVSDALEKELVEKPTYDFQVNDAPDVEFSQPATTESAGAYDFQINDSPDTETATAFPSFTVTTPPDTPEQRALQIRASYGVDRTPRTAHEKELASFVKPSVWDVLKEGGKFSVANSAGFGIPYTAWNAIKNRKTRKEVEALPEDQLDRILQNETPSEKKATKEINKTVRIPERRKIKEKYDAERAAVMKEYWDKSNNPNPSLNVVANVKHGLLAGKRQKEYNEKIKLLNFQELIDNEKLALDTGVPSDTKDFINRLTKNQEILDVLPFSPSELIRMMQLNSIQKKVVNGIPISEFEQAQLDDFALDNKLKSTFGQTTESGITQGVLAMVPYALEFYVSGGLATKARNATRKSVVRAIRENTAKTTEGYLGRSLGKTGEKALMLGAGGVAGAGVRTFAFNPHRIASGYFRRRLNQVDEYGGHGVVDTRIPQNSVLSALLNSAGDVFTGQLSESSGEAIGAIASKLSKPLRNKLMTASLFKTWRNIHPNTPKSAFVKVMNKLGKTGLVGEWSEERYNAVLNEILGIDKDQRGDTNWAQRITYQNAQQALIEAGVLMVGGGPVSVANTVQGVRQKRNVEQQLMKGYGVSKNIAKEYTKRLYDSKSEDETKAILDQLENEIKERVSVILNPNKGDVMPPEAGEWTLDDAQEIAQSSTPEEIKAIVAESLPETKKELETLLLDPNEETLAAFNAKIKEREDAAMAEEVRKTGVVPDEDAEDIPVDIDGAEQSSAVKEVQPEEYSAEEPSIDDLRAEHEALKKAWADEMGKDNPDSVLVGLLVDKIRSIEGKLAESEKAPVKESLTPEQQTNETSTNHIPDTTEKVPTQDRTSEQIKADYEVQNIYMLAYMIADHRARGETIPDELIEVAQSKLNADDAILSPQQFQDLVFRTEAEIKKEIEREGIKPRKPIVDLASLTPVSEEVGKLDELAVKRLNDAEANAAANLHYGFTNSKKFDKSVIKYSKKSGKSFEEEYPYLLNKSIRRRLNKFREKVEPFILDGDVQGTRSALLRLGIDPMKSTGRAYLFSAITFDEANRLASTQRRAEISDIKPNEKQGETKAEEPTKDSQSTVPNTDVDAGLPPIVRERIEEILAQFRARVGYNGMGLSPEDMSLLMRYAAYEQKYDGLVDEVKFEDLPKVAQEMVNRWLPVANEINDILLEIKDSHGVPHEGLSGFYYPLRHMLNNADMSNTTLEDAMLSTYGVSEHRKGKYYDMEGNPLVVEDPEGQLDAYLTDVARRMAIAEELTRQNNLVQRDADNIATAIEKQDAGKKLDDVDRKALDTFEAYKDLNGEASKFGFEDDGFATEQVFRMIAMYRNDGGGREIENPKLSYVIDPHHVVMKMDDINGKNKFGRYYGANTRMFDSYILRPAAELKNEQEARLVKQAELLRGLSQKEKKALSTRMHEDFFGDVDNPDKVERELMARKRYAMLNSTTLKEFKKHTSLKGRDAEIMFYHVRMLRESAPSIMLGRDIESKTSKLAREQRIEFHRLSRAMQEGVPLTDEEVKRYYDYGVKAGKKTLKGVRRQIARFLFEQASIEDKDFLGYFDAAMSKADKGKHFTHSVSILNAWAQYLENNGQKNNADWWRSRIDSGIKGNEYAWEDRILETIALTKERIRLGREGKTVDENGKELSREQLLEVADKLNIGDMKLGMKQAMQQLQRARVNSWLIGNYGWMLTTQVSSMALTASETGLGNIFKSMGLLLGGDSQISESLAQSLVTQIKKHRKGAQAFEAMGDIEQTKALDTRRAKMRNIASQLPSMMETKLTQISYVAGYIYAKETLGLSEEEARIHGDYVAATTQSMYDRVTRNGALNSDLLRAYAPFQSYVFTAMSQVLKTLGVTGKKLTKIEMLRRIVNYALASKLMSILYSMAFGDDMKKAILDPEFNKGTAGSAIPVFGKQVDAGIRALIPWQGQSYHSSFAPLEFGKEVERVVKGIAKDDEHAYRELLLLFNSYGAGLVGIPGGVAFKNFVDMESAKQNGYRFENIDGSLNSKHRYFEDPNVLRWAGGVMFGKKAVDGEKTFDKY